MGTAENNLFDYELAKDYLEKALEIQEKAWEEGKGEEEGEEEDRKALGLKIASNLTNMGNICCNLGEGIGSTKYHKRAMKIEEEVLGEEAVEVAVTLTLLGTVYGHFGSHEEAKVFFCSVFYLFLFLFLFCFVLFLFLLCFLTNPNRVTSNEPSKSKRKNMVKAMCNYTPPSQNWLLLVKNYKNMTKSR